MSYVILTLTHTRYVAAVVSFSMKVLLYTTMGPYDMFFAIHKHIVRHKRKMWRCMSMENQSGFTPELLIEEYCLLSLTKSNFAVAVSFFFGYHEFDCWFIWIIQILYIEHLKFNYVYRQVEYWIPPHRICDISSNLWHQCILLLISLLRISYINISNYQYH